MTRIASSPLAVALHYDHTRAPRVTAVGRGEIGRLIIETAKRHGVPLEENPELAEALALVDIDSEIPEALFKAVAVVLGYILRASGTMK